MQSDLSVQQAAEKTGLSVHTIRYYERIGLLPPIRRAANGHRRYSKDDLGWLEFLKCLRATGMPIAEMQEYVALQSDGAASLSDRLALLRAHRRRIQRKMQELESFLERLEGKIRYYQDLESNPTS